MSPSIVFLDEVDALVSSRGVDGEHEASRRLKTEFFSQMDGIASSARKAIGGSGSGNKSKDTGFSPAMLLNSESGMGAGNGMIDDNEDGTDQLQAVVV